MGRKLTRIKQPEFTSKIIGEEADIVLNTNEVFHGIITSVENSNITLKSFHSHILKFDPKNISEIIIGK
jgi:ribosome maturation factor RimP